MAVKLCSFDPKSSADRNPKRPKLRRSSGPLRGYPCEFEKAWKNIVAQTCPTIQRGANLSNLVMGSATSRQALDRFIKALTDQLRSQPGDVIAVIHGTVMALYCGRMFGVDTAHLWQRLTTPCFTVSQRVEQLSPGPGTHGKMPTNETGCASVANVGRGTPGRTGHIRVRGVPNVNRTRTTG